MFSSGRFLRLFSRCLRCCWFGEGDSPSRFDTESVSCVCVWVLREKRGNGRQGEIGCGFIKLKGGFGLMFEFFQISNFGGWAGF